MTVVADRAVAPETATATGPTLASWTRSARGPLLVLLALVLAGVLVGLLSRGGPSGQLDPDSYAPSGSHAVAALLRNAGVPVTRVDTVAAAVERAGKGDVLVLPEPSALGASELATLGRTPAALVVIGPDDDQLSALGVRAQQSGAADVDARRPACPLPAAVRAAEADLGGSTYRATQGAAATGCYASAGEASLLALPQRRAVLLGAGTPLTNDRLGQRGNAALALGVLSEVPPGGTAAAGSDSAARAGEVVWLVPRPGRVVPAGDRGSLGALLPDGLRLGALQLAIAVVVLALWRARRLGRVVEEPLPVVVRAAEAVEGRSRLYRAAGARAPAAQALRAASRERLGRRVGLAPSAPREALVETVAARVDGAPADIEAVLYGDAPGDDDALVRLADRLRTLEQSVSEGATGA